MHDLTALQRDLLFAIEMMDAPSGLALRADLQAAADTVIHDPQLYSALDALVALDLVAKGHQDGRTNAYTLTQRGHREIADRTRSHRATDTEREDTALPDWYSDRS